MGGSELLFKTYERPAGARSGLHQGEWWVDARGEWLRIESMPLGHIESVMALLVRRASAYAFREGMRMCSYAADASEHAADAIDAEMDAMDRNPEKWLKGTALYRALKRRRKTLRKTAKLHDAAQRLLMLPEITITRGGS